MHRAGEALSPAPFIAWAETIGGITRAERSMGIECGSCQRAALRARTQQAVSLRMVDGFFTAAEETHMLAILYPQDLTTMEDRWCPTCEELVTVGDDRLCPWCETLVGEPPRRAALGARPACAKAKTSTVETPARRRAKELRAAGLSYSAIACRLGVARSTAHGYVNAGS